MKKILVQIVVILFIAVADMSAQGAILADQVSGCDSLEVHFTITNVPDIGSSTAVEWLFGEEDAVKQTGPLTMTHKYTEPGVYSVRCILKGVFDIYESKLVKVGATPYADFKYNVTDIDGVNLEYSFEPQYFKAIEGINMNYSWSFKHNQDSVSMNVRSPVYYFPKNDTCYVSLRITDEFGCSGSVDSVMILGSDSLLIPNVFSPNDDGWNDYFKVTTSGDENWDFSVYTPAGLQVYSSNSKEIFWDGRTYGDKIVPEGVYYYVIVRASDTNERYKGYVYVFR